MDFIIPRPSTLPSFPRELLTGTTKENADEIAYITNVGKRFINNALFEFKAILQTYDRPTLNPYDNLLYWEHDLFVMDVEGTRAGARQYYKKVLALSNFEGWTRSTLTSIAVKRDGKAGWI